MNYPGYPQNPNFPGYPAQQPAQAPTPPWATPQAQLPQYGMPQAPQASMPQYGMPQAPQAPMPQYGMPPGYPGAGSFPAMPPHMANVPAVPPTMPSFDEAAVMASLAQDQKRAAASSNFTAGQFLNIPGPNGQPKWDASVPIGYEGSAVVHICPPRALGAPLYVTQVSHFARTRTNPKGISIPCSGDGTCRICALTATLPEAVRKQHAIFRKPRTRYIYNVLWLDNIQAHFQKDGTMAPVFLAGPSTLFTAINGVFSEAGGVNTVTQWQDGRPVRIIKKKTGPQDMDVEWSARHVMDRASVPQVLWPACERLHDLTKLAVAPDPVQIEQILAEMGFGQAMSAYAPGPGVPPYAPPYAMAPAAPPSMPPWQAPPMAPPTAPPWQMPAMPPPPAMAAPMPPPPAAPSWQMPSMPPPPPSMPAPSMPPPPPLITSAPSPTATQYAPIAGGAQPPPQPQQQPQQPPPQQPQQQAEVNLLAPWPPGLTLPGDRQRCFGMFNGADRWCTECPAWIQRQCTTKTASTAGAPPQASAPPAVDPALAALQQKLMGG